MPTRHRRRLSQAQTVSGDAQRATRGQDKVVTPAQAPKPRLMTRMERLAAERAEKTRQACEAQCASETPEQKQNREAAEQARGAAERARGYEL